MVKASSPTKVSANAKYYKGQNLNTLTSKDNFVTKTKPSNQQSPIQSKKIKERQELRNLYKKLGEVIPACQSKQVSSLDIVLRAVDYINELHKMLEEDQPNTPKPYPFANLNQIAANSARNMSIRDVTNVTMSTESRTTSRISRE